jgi:DNA ligase D-like protein (predicted polymerase)
MGKAKQTVLEVAGREVVITNPDKVYFPEAGHTKLDLARYYLAVAEGALRGIAGRPIVLKRYVNGAEREPFFQKRAPEQRPDWVETVELRFPSGRTAEEIVVRDAAQLLWIVNLGCIDLNPHPVRVDDLEHPDELRVDLDPGPGVGWDDVRRVALIVRDVLDEHGLRGWPKTSGSRGMHVNVRIERRWSFDQVRRAALALAREVERRAPEQATSKWWKEERHGVFLDYNQNAKDRTVASAWSVRPTADARVSMPLDWDEVADCDPAAFTLVTAPVRFGERGDASAGIDAAAGSLDKLLDLSAAQEAAGLGDAPWPPHYRKQDDEPPRVAPSRRKGAGSSQPHHERQGKGSSRRQSTQPLVTVSKAEHKEDALAGLERWKARHPEAAALLEVDDVLVDSMRGRYTTWTRIRLNLRRVPEDQRPAEEPPDPDYDPWRGRVPGAPSPKTRSSSHGG